MSVTTPDNPVTLLGFLPREVRNLLCIEYLPLVELYMWKDLVDLSKILWAMPNRMETSKNALCQLATLRNDLPMLKWARANGCPWNSWTCHNVDKHDNLELLEWAYQNGATWNNRAYHNVDITELMYLARWSDCGCVCDVPKPINKGSK